MGNWRINIAVLEPSEIIFEGLSNLFLRSEYHFYLYRMSDLTDLGNLTVSEKFRFVIVNPSLIQNKISEFTRIKKSMPETSWIGLVYSFFDSDLLNKLDETISITDSIDQISAKLKKIYSNTIEKSDVETLTERETDVLVQMVKGLSNKEIADVLNISIHTVISHRKNITEKTGIKSLSGLTIYAITKKIVPLDLASF